MTAPGPESAVAAVLGGAVTRERLRDAAGREGRGASPLVRSLLAQSLPSILDLARAYAACGGVLRLDASFLAAPARAARLVDPAVLRRERCVPVEMFDDLCVLVVQEGCAERAVRAVREVLLREILPVVASTAAIEAALRALGAPVAGTRRRAVPRKDSPIHARFRDLAIERVALDALPAREVRP